MTKMISAQVDTFDCILFFELNLFNREAFIVIMDKTIKAYFT